MLHRLEESGLVVRRRENEEEATPTYNWFLTPYGSRELQSRLTLLVKMLRASAGRHGSETFYWEKESRVEEVNPKLVTSAPEYRR